MQHIILPAASDPIPANVFDILKVDSQLHLSTYAELNRLIPVKTSFVGKGNI